jgi:uncharacterized protein
MSLKSLRIVLLTLLTLAWAGLAAAQSEPTIKQIYDTAQAGQLDKAQQMTQQVLRNHPKSAKAHFVMAELDAAKGNASEARAELAQAESLAPGLPFASSEAVQALRARVSSSGTRSADAPRAPAAATVRNAPSAPSFPWGLVILAAAAVAVVATVLRSRAAARAASGGAGSGPHAYDAPAGGPAWNPQPGYGPQAGWGPPPAQPGMGGRVMGGLATGLAVGAGALAAQEIGRHMLGEHGQQGIGPAADSHPGSASDSQLARDAGAGAIDGSSVGGAELPQDFGIADPGSWDDGGGSFDVGGMDDGGSWDS